jgi:hypothetical protein
MAEGHGRGKMFTSQQPGNKEKEKEGARTNTYPLKACPQ